MNIFVLDYNIPKCAQYACDKHVVKMILESSLLLCSPFDPDSHPAPYKRTHFNHPCSKWVRASKQNYEWLLVYADELLKEYSHRYGKIHKSSRVIAWCKQEYVKLMLPNRNITPFAQAMPDQYRHNDAVTAYRNYYIGEKKHFATWKNRDVPSWFCNINKHIH